MNHKVMTKEEALKNAHEFITLAHRMLDINRNEKMKFEIRYKAINLAEEAEWVASEYFRIAQGK